jgi:hypothetical protein
MDRLGVSYQDAAALRRCEMKLHRWYENECGNSNEYSSWNFERDEETGRPYMMVYPHNGTKTHRLPIQDREKGAKNRAAAIAIRYGMTLRHQTDPRGGALYLVDKDGREIYCNY